MTWLNRLCIRQLRLSEKIVLKRIRLATEVADLGLADEELHAQRMRARLSDIRARIVRRERLEEAAPWRK